MKKIKLLSLILLSSLISVAQLPVANFSVDDSTICPGTCTNFTNLSTNATSYQWTFAGANPTTSTAADPQNICYNTPGIYSVTLIATNANGNDTLTIINCVRVYSYPPALGVTAHGDTLFVTQGFPHYQWYLNGILIPGDTLTWHVAMPDGIHSPVATDSDGCEVEAAYSGFVINPGFVASDTEFCAGSCISFTNLSIPADTINFSHQWHFYGANPSVSLDNNPQNICYSTAGNYQVKLVMISSILSRSDSFIVSVLPCTGILENSFQQLSLSPNPFSSELNLHLNNSRNTTALLKIFNSIGEVIVEKEIKLEDQTLDLTALSQGIYFVTVKTDERIFTEKIVK